MQTGENPRRELWWTVFVAVVAGCVGLTIARLLVPDTPYLWFVGFIVGVAVGSAILAWTLRARRGRSD